jgi:tetratricopeptide (TPR) repeat protein
VPAPDPALTRKIEPVTATAADLRRAWVARRKALREQDVAGAEEAERKILAVQQELGVEELRAFATAELRDAQRALAAHLDADAVAHAQLAARLAPSLPEAHLALARAHLARDPSHPGLALRALGHAASAALKDPYTSRALGADLAVALGAALLAAGAAATVVLLLARLPLLLHDFHDLPLVRAGTPVQAGLLALALLVLPVAIGLGPLGALAACATAAWLYLRLAERLVVTVALLAFAAAPLAAEHAARAASFTGTLAQDVWEVERGVGDEEAARLAALAEREQLPAPALAALAGHAKRRGDLDGARRWYDRSIEGGGRGAEVLVNLGNVHLLRGDADAAKAAWLDAADRAGPNLDAFAAAELNLAKLYVRQSSLDQAQEARRRAAQASPEVVERRAPEDDVRANRWLIDVPVPTAAYRALAAQDPAPAALGASVRATLGGALPAHLWPWAPLALVALLWLSTLVARRMRPSQACEKCGRPACPRCDAATPLLCGQCVNVFLKKGVVDARDRVRKDHQVRRHARLARLAARAGALAGGGAGHLLRGEAWRGFAVLLVVFFAAFLAVLHRGLLPPPQPTPGLSAARLVGGVALGAIAWAGAVRGVFRRTRG